MRETFAHHIAGHVAVMERNKLEISGHKGSFERAAGVPCSCLGQQTPLPQAREGAWGGLGLSGAVGRLNPHCAPISAQRSGSHPWKLSSSE